jgi:hypothetical protein
METFIASAQYNDLKGAVAADRADKNDPSTWLQANGHINDQELVLGISMFVGENHGKHEDPVYVNFLVSELHGYSNVPELVQSTPKPIQVRKIQLEMGLTDFFGLFKRFSVTLSTDGMG